MTFHDRAARHKIGEGAQAHVLDVAASGKDRSPELEWQHL